MPCPAIPNGGLVLSIRTRFIKREFSPFEEIYDLDFRVGDRPWVTVVKWKIRRLNGRYIVTFIPGAQFAAKGYTLEAIHWTEDDYQKFLDYAQALEGA